MLKRNLIVLSLIAAFTTQLSAKYIYSYNRTFEVSYTYFHSLYSTYDYKLVDNSIISDIFTLYNFGVYVPLPLQLGIGWDYGYARDAIAPDGTFSAIAHTASYQTVLLTYEIDDHHRLSVGGRLHGAYSDPFSAYTFDSTLGYVAGYEFFIGEHGLMAAGVSYEYVPYVNSVDNQSYTQQNIKAHLKFGLRGLRGLLGLIKGSI